MLLLKQRRWRRQVLPTLVLMMLMLPELLPMMLKPMLMSPCSAGARASHAAPWQPLALPPHPSLPSVGAPLVAAATVPAPAPRTSLLPRPPQPEQRYSMIGLRATSECRPNQPNVPRSDGDLHFSSPESKQALLPVPVPAECQASAQKNPSRSESLHLRWQILSRSTCLRKRPKPNLRQRRQQVLRALPMLHLMLVLPVLT